MELQEALAQKIDSPEKYEELCRRYEINSESTRISTPSWAPYFFASQPWWVHREVLRSRNNLYDSTTVLETLNRSFPHHQVHVSREDPTMVAYTPDRESGLRDKQLRISLGRLLLRLYPHAPDTAIASIVSDHEAEINLQVEFLTDADAIEEAYKTGPQSCMSKPFVGMPHPSRVYASPGIALAVLRKNGKVSARCLVYEHSPTDKRFIRNWGDNALRKKLMRMGYKPGTLVGATLNLIKYGDHYMLLPYIDGNEGPGDSKYSTVGIIDGVLRVLNNKQRKELSGFTTCATNTGGYTNMLKNVDSQSYIFTDGITGQKVNALVDEVYEVFDGTNTIKTTQIDDTVEAYTYSGYELKPLRITRNVPVFNYRLSPLIDTDANRTRAGYVRLSKTFYPDEQDWKLKNNLTLLSDGAWIKQEDVVWTVKQGGSSEWQHKSAKLSTWVKIHAPSRGDAVYALDASYVVKTNTGRKVVPGFHEVIKIHNGPWVFQRSAKSYNLFGKVFWFEKSTVVTGLVVKDLLLTQDYDLDRITDSQLGRINVPEHGLYKRWSTMALTEKLSVLENRRELYLSTNMRYVFDLHAVRLAEMQAVEAPAYLIASTTTETQPEIEDALA